MLRRVFAAALALSAIGCAGTQKTEGGGDAKKSAAAAKEEKIRIYNTQEPFDLAVCTPPAVTLPEGNVNTFMLTGAILKLRPHIMECLVDPKARAEGDETKVTVKTTVNEQGAQHAVTGTNLAPAGQQCIEQVVNSAIKPTATPAGGKPVEASAEFVHVRNNSPTVTVGNNVGSDMTGAIRLGMRNMCDCFKAEANTVPAGTAASITLKKDAAPEIVMGAPAPAAPAAGAAPAPASNEPGGTPEMNSCLQGKIAALQAPALTTDALKLPAFRFILLNSNATGTEAAASLVPTVRFVQYDLQRSQRAADAAFALGSRQAAAEIYSAAVTKFQKLTPGEQYRQVKDLSAKCKVLTSASGNWVKALEAQLALDQQTVALAGELVAQDPDWAKVQTAAQGQVDQDTKDITEAKGYAQKDQASCPKVK